MAKTAADFLNDLAERELAPVNIIASLRRQVAAATKPVSAASIARLLVEKGHLTAVQAERLLGAPLGAAARAAPAGNAPSPGAPQGQPAPSLTETKPLEPDELGLAPLEESPATPIATSQPATSATERLEPLDLELLGLTPLDETPATASPKPAAAAQAGPVSQRPAAKFKTPSAPVKNPAAASSPSASPLTELQPLEPLPLDALSPLPSPPAAVPRPARASTAAPSARVAAAGVATKIPPAPIAALPTLPATAQPTAAKPAASPAGRVGTGRWRVAVAAIVVLLAIGGVLAAWLLTRRGTGEDQFALAQQEYQAKQYAAAAEKYGALLKSYPRHPQAAMARVRLGVARILAAKMGGDWNAALPVAREVLVEIDHEPELAQVHPELAPLLSEMAVALVTKADAAGANQVPQHLADAKEALTLANNGRYVPGALRAWQRLFDAEEMLAALQRRQESAAAIEKFLGSAEKSIGAGDCSKINAERDKLLASFPELADDARLRDVGQRAAKVAAAGVQSASELPKAITDARPGSVTASMIFTHQPVASAPGPTGTFVTQAGSSVWALDAAIGEILWRRSVGSAARIGPVHLTETGGVLLVDARHRELFCVDNRSGEFRWRHAFESSIAGPPLPLGDKVFVTSKAGRLTCLSAESGDAVAAAALSTAAIFGPAADATGKRLYQLADRDYLYVLSADSLKCDAAVFVGHRAACIDTPPLVLGDRIFVAENRDIDRAVLHVVPRDESDLLEGSAQQVEVAGHVITPPVVFEQRLLVLTDRGAVVTFELPAKPTEPLVKVGEATVDSAGFSLRFGVNVGNQLCLAESGLKQFDFAPASGSMKAKWTAFQGEVFESSPQVLGDALLAVRRRAAGAGWIAAAVKASDGQLLWETPLAMSLIELSTSDGMALAVSSAGAAAQIPLADVIHHRTHELSPLIAGDKQWSIAASVLLANGNRVLIPTGQPRELLLVDARGKSARPISLPDALAGVPLAAADGLIVPCAGGAVYYLNGEGRLEAGPFQMSMQAGTRLERCSCVAGSASGQCVVSDGRGEIYLLAVESGAAPQLKLLATTHLAAPPIAPVAALGEHVFVVTRGGKLLSLSLPDLKPGATQPLGADAIEFGPVPVGDMLLLATNRQELVSIGSEGRIRWKVPFDGALAGASLEPAGSLIAATQQGTLVRLAADSGKEMARVDLAEPLRGAPMAIGSDVFVATADGVLLKVALGGKQETTP